MAREPDRSRGRSVSQLHLGDFFSNRQEPGRPGLPVMSVTMNDSLVLRDDLDRRTESALRPDQHLLVRKGDIAYNMMRMWQGACGIAEADGIVSPAYVVLQPKKNIDSRFAYHWFKSARMIHLFWAYSHGLTEDRLRLYFASFSEIPVSPPPLSRQKQIAIVLDAWDEVIGQTERLIAAKRCEFSALYATLIGVDREKSKLNSKWVRKKLGDVISLVSGQHVASGLVNTAGFGTPYLTGPSDFTISSPVASAWVKAPPVNCSEGDILVTVKGSGVGTMSIADQSYCISRQLMAITPKSVEEKFLFYVCEKEISSIARSAHGLIPQLTRTDICNIPILLPGRADQVRISRLLDCVREQENALSRLAGRLISQKRGLMQKLLTGEWRLGEDFE